MSTVLHEGTFRSVFAKMLYAPAGMGGGKPFDGQLLDDLSEVMGQATAEEKQVLGPDVLDAWGDLEHLTVCTPGVLHDFPTEVRTILGTRLSSFYSGQMGKTRSPSLMINDT